jgi:hypothetical protein
MRSRVLFICVIPAVMMVMITFSSAQQVPQLINYQGRLTDSSGQPIDGTREMRFRILDADTISASVLWSETHSSVQVDQGIYHVLLGSVNALPPSAMSQADIFLEVRMQGEILRPRSQITSVPFAHKAASVPDSSITSAMIADGTITGSDINTQTITSTNIAYETITSTQIQDSSIAGSDLQNDSLGTDQIQDIYVLNTGDTVTGDLQVNGNQSIGLDLTVSGGHIGIGTAPSPSYGIINNSATAPTYGAYLYGSSYGIYGALSSDPNEHFAYLGTNNAGVSARAGDPDETGNRYGGSFDAYSQTFSYGVYGRASAYGANSAFGVWGHGYNESSGNAYGGYFSTDSSGTGTHYGVYASADDYAGWFQDGRVHIGNAGTQNYVDGDGDLYVEDQLEVDGMASLAGNVGIGYTSPSYQLDVRTTDEMIAVYGKNTRASSSNYGVYGLAQANYDAQYGVYGATYIDSTSNYFGIGVEGFADCNNSSGSAADAYGGHFSAYADDDAYGVYAYGQSDVGTNWAGYFSGNVNVTGTISKGGGSFKIDHPLDPENRYLMHSFVESPDMKNVYDGVVVLDSNGEAWVELAEWFEALNRDVRYQLTAIGSSGPDLYIAEKIQGNRFKIAGGTPGMEVSWQVTGIRQDAFANTNRIPVEVEKSEEDRGKYIHPKVFGKSEELGIDYKHRIEAQELEKGEGAD